MAPTTTPSSDPVGTVVKITSSTYWSVPVGWTRVRAIIVAGAGGGGTTGTSGLYDGAGGGGAGGVLDITMDVSPGAMLPIVIGAGGQAGDMNTVTGRGRNGADSSFAFNTAKGGGGGGGILELTAAGYIQGAYSKHSMYVSATYDFHGLPGGSGGGSLAPSGVQAGYNAPGTEGQGTSGGEAYDNGFSGGGGGAGSRGMGNGGLSWGPNKNSAGAVDSAVSGGSGLGYTFGGTSFVVGGGGGVGGVTWNANPSITRSKGGWGGGGDGDGGAISGEVNTGGGGGGGSSWWGGNNPGGPGGSGVVYLVKV